jgi:two-component system sporulation sensor kinase A
LNNYLNIVQSNFELLKLKAKITNSDDVDKYIRGIEESLEQMTRFTIGLVDSAKLKSEKTEFDLDDLIEDIVSFLSPQKKYRQIKLIHNKSGNLPRMTADAQQLQQLFYNLLNNAAESFPEDSEEQLQISITTQLSGSDVKIDVVDNGSGIPKHLQKTMFSDRFTTKTSGHGFGLLVCKKVVESHNGQIAVESTEGRGTVFHITFPTSS